MKLSEVVRQMQLVIPKFTDLFSIKLNIDTITSSGSIAIITTTSSHNLSTGFGITISNVSQNNPIDSIVKDGFIFTLTTINNHDLTLDYPTYENSTFDGFSDSFWNDSFKLIDVIDRKTFKIQSTNPIPILNGNEFLSEVRIDGVNGRHSITVTGPNIFTISGSFNDGVYNNGEVKTAVRISGTALIERALEQYTKQSLEDLWMFVVMTDANVSKNRNAYNDTVASIVNGEDIRIRLVDGFSIFLVKNVKDDIAAVGAIDICRHDLLQPILKSVFGTRFETGLDSCGDFRAIFTGHSFVDYNRSTLVYQYNFEFTYDLTNDDAVDEQDTKAFSDIIYTQVIGDNDVTDVTFDLELPNPN